ncbi:nitrogenase molybdenum-iron protein beta chain [archaeon]|nr:nitrogenase molybdenum-iron protein beta chain [archaeon]
MSTVTKQKRAVAINPTRSCAPIGAMLATYGVHGALTINHGSQGCATYPRHQMARHFREPIEVATTSLTEKTTIYGGRDNLIAAMENVYERYHPTMITVCSTCLSETIGDDITGIVDEFVEGHPDVDIPIITVNTPSYIGTHITGFDNFLKTVAMDFPVKDKPNGKVNIMPGWVNPGDIREIEAMTRKMGIEGIFLTDYSDTLDGGIYRPKPQFPKGGTTIEELRDSANSLATIALQKHVGGEAAEIYEKQYGIPAYTLPMPIGIENTDKFIKTLSKVTGREISEELRDERARLLDAIIDAHMFLTSLKVAIFGDPDVVEGLVRLAAEIGLEPKFALTSSDFKPWGEDMMKLSDELGLDMEIMMKSDLHELYKKIKEEPVDLIFGTSKGRFIEEDLDIPLIRMGFPIEDRFGYHRRAIVGYRGGIYLVDKITNAVLTKKGLLVSNTLLEKPEEGAD